MDADGSRRRVHSLSQSLVQYDWWGNYELGRVILTIGGRGKSQAEQICKMLDLYEF